MKRISVFIIFLFSTSISFAQHETEHSSHDHDSHAKHNNHLALFVGNTSQHDFEQNAFTIGLDYMYFFPKSEHWGISAFGEIIYAHHTELLFGTPLMYKINNWWMRAGPGIELAKDEHNDIEYYFLGRIGTGYDFHLNKITLSPSVDFDGMRKHPAVILGLNIGFGF